MNKAYFILLVLLYVAGSLSAQRISDYNVVWNTPSVNSSESMPCGGGDVGLNVWSENGDILFYFSRSGTFDEHNALLKLGRIRIRLTPNPFDGGYFRQELKLGEGCVVLKGENSGVTSEVLIWADVTCPVVRIEIENNKKLKTEVFYENWRYEDRLLRKQESNQNSYKWAAPSGLKTKKDSVYFENNKVLFYHRNDLITIFDKTVEQQGLDSIQSMLFNPLKNLTFGGTLEGEGLKAAGTTSGKYADTDFKAWKLESDHPVKKCNVELRLYTAQTESVEEWKSGIPVKAVDKKASKEWWSSFWNRSFIHIDFGNKESKGFEIARNYQLFRYMLACNAIGEYPTKFNGGLFTFDPLYVDTAYRFTPDFRKWGGGTHTAQNQRLVYFPMLKSGDIDLMKPQFEFYRRLLPTAEWRSRVYWGHEGACFTEQMENFGLPNPSEYGWKRPPGYDKGMEYNAWLEYQWDTALEFCFMILESYRYTGKDIAIYLPFIESTLRFFDEHYQHLASRRGRKTLDGEGKLILYPGSACETYKMATNATSTIAALETVCSRLLDLPGHYLSGDRRTYFSEYQKRIPSIRTREIEGKTTIAPAWLWERINNVETPQLYPVFPWGIYGWGKPGLEIAVNTWKYDPDVIRFRSHVGWKQDVIWAARLGLASEAWELLVKKMESGNHRFPAFWGPGYDWTPDHNWGGSGMIALQEMLMQTDGDKIYLLPAWPKDRDVHFKLHAPDKTIIECIVEKGRVKKLSVLPEMREKNIILDLYSQQPHDAIQE